MKLGACGRHIKGGGPQSCAVIATRPKVHAVHRIGHYIFGAKGGRWSASNEAIEFGLEDLCPSDRAENPAAVRFLIVSL